MSNLKQTTCNTIVSVVDLDCKRGKEQYNGLAELCSVGECLQLSLVRERESSWYQCEGWLRFVAEIQSSSLSRLQWHGTLSYVDGLFSRCLRFVIQRSRLWAEKLTRILERFNSAVNLDFTASRYAPTQCSVLLRQTLGFYF